MRRISELLLLAALGLAASHVTACSDGGNDAGGGGGGSATVDAGAGGFAGTAFNQCGVGAPPPANNGQCAAVSAPTITNFDDYTGGAASSYTYYVNSRPPAPDAVLGAILHVGDGSDMGGTPSVITTEMVPGENGGGYALRIADSNALHWGGLLMLYFPAAPTAACLDAHGYGGLAFSIQGASPTGRIAVTVGMLDTIPTTEHGLCDSVPSSDCKDATIEVSLPADATMWTRVQLPWSSFTPGVGSGKSCVPVTGQNVVRLVIQPLMRYPPPDYMFAPGPYTIAVDDVRFY